MPFSNVSAFDDVYLCKEGESQYFVPKHRFLCYRQSQDARLDEAGRLEVRKAYHSFEHQGKVV